MAQIHELLQDQGANERWSCGSCLEIPKGQMRQRPLKQEESPVPFTAKIMTRREKNKTNSALKPEISQHRSFGCEHSRERPCLITSKLPQPGPEPVPKWIVRQSLLFIFTKVRHVFIYIAWPKKVDHKQANKTCLSIFPASGSGGATHTMSSHLKLQILSARSLFDAHKGGCSGLSGQKPQLSQSTARSSQSVLAPFCQTQ